MKTLVSACMAVCLAGMVGGCIMAPYGPYGTYQTYPAYQTYQTTSTTVQPATTNAMGVFTGTNGPAPTITTTVVTVPAQAPVYYYAEPPPVYVWPCYPGIWIGGGRGWYGGGHGRGWR